MVIKRLFVCSREYLQKCQERVEVIFFFLHYLLLILSLIIVALQFICWAARIVTHLGCLITGMTCLKHAGYKRSTVLAVNHSLLCVRDCLVIPRDGERQDPVIRHAKKADIIPQYESFVFSLRKHDSIYGCTQKDKLGRGRLIGDRWCRQPRASGVWERFIAQGLKRAGG